MYIDKFFLRCIACSVGTIATYPLETLKLKTQTKKEINYFDGVEIPIIFNGFSKGIRLHIFLCRKAIFNAFSTIICRYLQWNF